MAKKPNRNSPATAEQCAAAHEAGVSEGNGIALPCAQYVMEGIAEVLYGKE